MSRRVILGGVNNNLQCFSLSPTLKRRHPTTDSCKDEPDQPQVLIKMMKPTHCIHIDGTQVTRGDEQ